MTGTPASSLGLSEFIIACITEDERLAREELARRAEWQRQYSEMVRSGNTIGLAFNDWDAPGAPGDPARVLAECETKRRIVDACVAAIDAGDIKPLTSWNDDAAGAEIGEAVFRLLAVPYADRPGYRPEWAHQ